MSGNDRIVVLIDMDCFFCQVETKLQPEYAGKPLAVVQYNQWQLGGIIAVNYEARDFGVTRHMRGAEAKEKCPDLILASVPCLRGKSDTSRYRNAGREVINVIRNHCRVVERASVDEAYLDITDIVNKRIATSSISSKALMAELSNTHVLGYTTAGDNNDEATKRNIATWLTNIFEELEDVQSQKLAIAAVMVEKLREDILQKTGFKCSAGISQNKILAKLACGLHKPNQQTVLPAEAVPELYKTLPVKKVRNLGGKFGDVIVESLGCNVMGDLLQYSLPYLQKRFDSKTGSWLYNIARGIDNEPVTTRLLAKSIGACKKFPGKEAIVAIDVLQHWIGELSEEVCERLEQDLEENQRRATLLTVCYHYYQNRTTISQSRSCALSTYKPEKMANMCVEIIAKSTQCPIAYLGISVGKFIGIKGTGTFMNFFTTEKTSKNKLCSDKDTTTISSLDGTSTSTSSKITGNNSEDITLTNKIGRIENKQLLKETEKVTVCKETNKKGCTNMISQVFMQTEKVVKTILPSESRMDESQTSKKVCNLMKSCNGENKLRLQKSYASTISDHFVSNDSEYNNFKESFFMNMWKDNTKRNVMNKEKLNGVINKGNDSGRNEDSGNECLNTVFIVPENRVNEAVEVSNKCLIKEDINFTMQESKEEINNEDLILKNQCIFQHRRNKELFKETNLHANKAEIKNSEMANAISSESNALSTKYNSLVQLQELFPNLNDIDLDILAMLPNHLQEEAKLHLKVQTQCTDKNIITRSGKNLKTKHAKCKLNVGNTKKYTSIDSFLIKKSLSNSDNDLFRECTQCNQMISVIRYNEHKDFHIAEHLQQEINKSIDSGTSGKRKYEAPTTDDIVKRRPNVNIPKTLQNGQLITAFLL